MPYGIVRQPNSIIISEDGNGGNPDDKRDGGALMMTFTSSAAIAHVVVIDIEPAGSNLVVTQADGQETLFDFAPVGDSGVETIAINLDNVTGLTFNLGTSGGIAFVGCTAAPPQQTSTPVSTST